MIDKKNILGVDITDATKEETLEYIIKSLENFQKKFFCVTPNPEFLVLANENLEFKNILNRAELASADGIGVLLAAKILGKTLKGRFTGVDLVESLCKRVVRKPITVGFLGGKPGVAEKTAECLLSKYPELKVVFVSSGDPNEDTVQEVRSKIKDLGLKNKEQEREKIINHKSLIINHPSIDILFIAFGAPKQEIWISENLENLPVKIAIGVGGAFDYISGQTSRAPVFIRNIGLEWLYRLIIQPWRIKRQLSLLKFIRLIIKEKINPAPLSKY